MSFDPATSEGYLVNLAARAFARNLSRRVAPHGGVPAEFPILLALRAQDGLPQAELAAQAGIEQGSVAELLKRMDRDGLVARRRDPADGRRVLHSLTPKARRLVEVMTTKAVEVNTIATAGLTVRERRELHRLLHKTIENLAADETA